LFKRTLSTMLSGALIVTTFGILQAGAQTANPSAGTENAQIIDKTRAKVERIGIGQDARVEVKLRDNTRVKGYISAASQDSFSVTDRKTGAVQTIAYSDAVEVKKHKGGLSTRSWIIIGGVAAAIVIVGVTVVRPVLCDGC
jgi:hypothetical protein